MIELLDLPGLREREAAEPGFAAALAASANAIGLVPDFIGAVMSRESGFNPAAVNPSGGATGLIQFMPATARSLGTTTDALRSMSAIEQLPYVQKFFARVPGIRPEIPGDYYMATFMPAYVGKDPGFLIAVPGDPVYDQNQALDTDHNGGLTVSDVTAAINSTVNAALKKPRVAFDDSKKKSLAAELPPSPPSPQPASPSGSSSPLSGLGGAANLRNLVVFAASCHLEDVTLMVERRDPSSVAEFVAKLWDDVLEHPSPRNAAGTRILKYPPEWCGAFALRCLHEAELGRSIKWAFGPPNYGFLFRLHHTATPEPGDIAYLDKPYEHHAIVTDVEGETVHTIDGNQGAASPIKTHSAPLSHWSAFYSILPLITEAIA